MMKVDQLYQKGLITQIDQHFAQLMARHVSDNHHIVKLAAALVSRATAHGSVCLDLSQIITLSEKDRDGQFFPELIHIDPRNWDEELRGTRVVGLPGEYKPLILDGTRLYLQRHWQYEQEVALGIQRRSRLLVNEIEIIALNKLVDQAFPEGDLHQRRAVLSALTQGFTVISGGPGTGKTFTIAKLMLLMQKFNHGNALRIQLAAPTGKAAMRLEQAIGSAMAALGQSQEAIQVMGGEIQTLHRLLGAMTGQSGFRYHRNNQLQVDAVIVDEASMIDLSLMAALTAALPDPARLILIGDKNQLASVEAGAVLGDICAGIDTHSKVAPSPLPGTEKEGALESRIVVLQHSYRFADQGGIGDLAAAVNTGDVNKVKLMLNKQDAKGLKFKEIKDHNQLVAAMDDLVTNAIIPNFKFQSPHDALIQMERLMILSPLRNGPFGVLRLNRYIEQMLVKHGLISQASARVQHAHWYAGRPVMITRNDYYHNLYNGDVGIALPNSSSEAYDLSVFFKDGKGGCKQLSYRLLPPHETAYAMTVHKSQGSEFDRVVLVLPDKESPVMTRELIYTAITRARHSVEIWGTTQRLNQAIQQRTIRSSGLMQLLW